MFISDIFEKELEIINDKYLFEPISKNTAKLMKSDFLLQIKNNEFIQWLDKNCIGGYNFDPEIAVTNNSINFDIKLSFNNDQDRMLFKLTWG